MTFEEFFIKKRINLAALQSSEPGLFSEFKLHFEQMGEKSFDHTKKYWFNKLRLLYHLAPELKPEKIHLENQLAEQTITESILEEKIPAPSVGFKPRFKPGMGSKPAEAGSDIKNPLPQESATSTPGTNKAVEAKQEAAEPVAPKPAGFKPRFNSKMVASKTAEPEVNTTHQEQAATDVVPASETAAPKPAGFKPRFNSKMVTPKTTETEETPAVAQPPVEYVTPEAETAAVKPTGFKPRFNMKMAAAKPVSDEVKEPATPAGTEPAAAEVNEIAAAKPDDAPVSKPAGFKPRFNMKNVKPKPPEE